MDQMGEVDYAPGEPKGTSWHPHRGFETVTYMIDGIMQHQDSTGGGGVITDGATQWMTAGAGILHIEAPPEALVAVGRPASTASSSGSTCRPRRSGRAPRYQDIGADAGRRCCSSPDGGALVRVIAGDVGGQAGPGSTRTPISFVHATVSPGARLELPWRPDFNALVYALSGHGTVGADGRPFEGGQLAVLGAGDVITVSATQAQDSHTPALDVLILGGRPIREPVAQYGPFVMNTRAELVQAFEDFQAGRMGVVPVPHV